MADEEAGIEAAATSPKNEGEEVKWEEEEEEVGVSANVAPDDTNEQAPAAADVFNDDTNRQAADEQPGISSSAATAGNIESLRTTISRADKPLIVDHFTLQTPSSVVRFRGADVRVYGHAGSQMLLEEEKSRDGSGGPHRISVKERRGAGYGLYILRGLYTLVSVFMAGWVFIFGLELLLFLFIDLATEVGATHAGKDRNDIAFVGVLLSVPIFVYSFGLVMTMVGRFVGDTWAGHPFLRTFGNWSSVITEWVTFLFYICIPFIAMIVGLFSGDQNWLANTTMTWWASIFIFWAFFACGVVYYEVQAALFLIGEAAGEPDMPLRQRLAHSIIHSQNYRLAGTSQESYIVNGDTEEPPCGNHTYNPDEEPFSTYMGLYSRYTKWKCVRCLYETLEEPMRVWTLDEARGIKTFVTADSWSLEALYCRDRTARTIAVVRGPSKVTRHQAASSFACLFLGSFAWLLGAAGILVWFNLPSGAVAIIVVFICICLIPGVYNSVYLYKTYKSLLEASRIAEEKSMRDHEKSQAAEGVDARESMYTAKKTNLALYQVTESFRVTSPHDPFCWSLFAFEIVFFFLWPFIYLCTSRNFLSAVLFFFLSMFSILRHYLNPVVLLTELGTFGNLGNKKHKHTLLRGDLADVHTDKEWKAKSRLSEIVSTISAGKVRTFWSILYIILVLFFIVVAVIAVAQGTTTESKTANQQLILSSGFYYEPQLHLQYPTCQLKKGLGIESIGEEATRTSLIDYGFLANIGYVQAGDDTTFLLDRWFGSGNAFENVEMVEDFKKEKGYENSVAVYKFITFPKDPGHGIVTIRGTQNAWDVIADAQIWLAAGLFQGLRALLPAGQAWTEILHKLIYFVTALETDNIEKVSYYREIGEFVQQLQQNGTWPNLQVTGHSLGGGLALITGAQNNIPGIGLSAPNAMLSRETFVPRGSVTKENLDQLTFNIIPVGDLIPMLDDTAYLYQNIRCLAQASNFTSCHDSQRSLCEMMYSCGSFDRPVPCNCVGYEYDDPTAANGTTMSFEESCKAAELSAP